MLVPQILGACLLIVGATAVPTPSSSHVLHEKRESAPRQWEKRAKVDPSILLPVRIGLTQTNLEQGAALFHEISTPGNDRYGKHLSSEEVHDLFAPSKQSVELVSDWLSASGIDRDRVSQSVNKQWIQFDATAEELEALVLAEFHHYEHTGTGQSNIGCDQYHVPQHVQEHVDYITPGLKLLTPSVRQGASKLELEKRTFGVTGNASNSSEPNKPILPPLKAKLPVDIQTLLSQPLKQSCQQGITPDCISTLYNITKATKAAQGNQLGIFEDLGDVYSQTDLDDFFTNVAKNIPKGTSPTLNSIDGAKAPVSVADAGGESDLDFQISWPIIYPQKTILFQTDDPVYEANYQFQGFLNNFLDAIDGSYCTYSAFGETGNSDLDPPYPNPAAGGYKGQLQCGVYKPTNVISISYGGQEDDLPASYQQRQCNEFMKLGMQGVSVVVSSGDSGVAGPSGDGAEDGCLGDSGTIFSPDFPVTCPYVTAVGATFLPTGADVTKDQETAVTRFPSGGGFSNIFPIPSYQSDAVAGYLKNSPPPYASYSSTNNDSFGANGGIFNRNGRAYPDVSAIGDRVVVYNKGKPILIGGTSASAPVFASILTRINEERIAAGKETVGFVNPTLYANPGALHDITTGSNPGCNTQGFSCAPGWDPVTGLGTPNYPALLKVFMAQ